MKSYTSDYKILLVDDVPTDVMLIQIILKKEGYSLLTADSAGKALQITRDLCPNIILLDIMSPKMSGFEILRQLKNAPDTHHIPVIILSALNDMITVIKGYHLGAMEYINKPFQKEEIIKRIAQHFQLYTLERMRQELEESLESRDVLYSIISHDLRSPLGSLKSMNHYILQMVNKEVIGEETYEMLSMMNKLSEESFQLLDNLMKWNKVTSDKVHPFKERTDINSLIESIVDFYKPIAALKDVSIVADLPENPLQGMIDIDMVKTIIRNLLSGVIYFTCEQGSVSVSAGMENDMMYLQIKNSGGADCKDLEKILMFGPEFLSYPNHPDGHRSFGFGLYIAKNFIDLHGGKLSFSTDKAKGVHFYFTLKINEE